jgi:hypothetical protein
VLDLLEEDDAGLSWHLAILETGAFYASWRLLV